MQTKQPPGALKAAVCPPGGSTIAGVHALEKGGLRASVYNAMPIEGAEALVEFLKAFEASH